MSQNEVTKMYALLVRGADCYFSGGDIDNNDLRRSIAILHFICRIFDMSISEPANPHDFMLRFGCCAFADWFPNDTLAYSELARNRYFCSPAIAECDESCEYPYFVPTAEFERLKAEFERAHYFERL